jgi:hypothetical protein
MYSNSVKDGTVQTERAKVIALLENGEDCEVTPELAGLSFFGFMKVFLMNLQAGNKQKASELRERIASRVGQPVKSLRVETEVIDLKDGRLSKHSSSRGYDFE